MKKTLFSLLLLFVVQMTRAQDTVSLQVCTSFWANGEHIEGAFISGAVNSMGLPPVVLFYEDTTCVDYTAVVPDDFPPNFTINFVAEKDGDDDNGVNVLDLIAISSHILGIAPLATPYAIIAADANKSNSVTTFDLVETRKLILEVYSEFPNNTSWRFFPENCTFPNPANPFSGAGCPGLSPDELLIYDDDTFDIIGVKVGDVTGDASPVGQYNGPVYDDSISLILPDIQLLAGVPTTIDIQLGAHPVGSISGLQTAFLYDTAQVEVVGIGQTTWFDMSGFGLFSPGRINAVSTGASSIPLGEPVMKIIVQANENVALSDVFSLNPSIKKSMAAAGQSNVETFKLIQTYGVSSGTYTPTAKHRVSAAFPNPFSNQTAIDLELSQSETVRLEVFDLNGQLRHYQQNPFPAGRHQLTIPAEALGANQMAMYRIQAGDFVATGKVLRMMNDE